MAAKLILLADPGIDGAFAITLGLLDPDLDVLALAASAGNVPAEQATRNMQIVVEQVDPPRLPRLGAALPVEYDVDGTRLHVGRLGNTALPCAELHHAHPGDKLIGDLARQNPEGSHGRGDGSADGAGVSPGSRARLAALLKRDRVRGWHPAEPGNAGPCSEFHFFCDPPAARKVLRCGAAITLVPLDVSRKLLFSPADLLELPSPDSRACRFLRQIVSFGIGQTSNLYGIEGFHLKDVLGIGAVALPQALTTKPMAADVEVRGELTRGMCVFDQRRDRKPSLNVEVVTDVEVPAVRDYLRRVLAQA